MSGMQNQNWQRQTEEFEQIKEGSPSLVFTSGLQRRLEITQKYISFKGKTILDIGCGIGIFLREFEKLTKKENIFGIETDDKKVKIAKKNYSNVIKGTAEDIPFKDNFFDIIWLHEVIEHVIDDKKTIEESVRVLKEKGYIIIFAPNRLWPIETHGIYLEGKYYFGNIPLVTWLPNFLYKKLTPHVRNYSNRSIEALFKDLNVRIILHSHIFPGFSKIKKRSPFWGKIAQEIFHFFEKTPFHNFGLSHFLIVQKTHIKDGT